MVHFSALWAPILVSSLIVFATSFLIHMVLPWHKSDYPQMPNEQRVRDALRPLAIPPGDYMIPRPQSTADMRSPEFAEKMKAGPVMVVTVMPNGPMSMGRSLALWFVYILVVGVLSAYITGRALGPGTPYLPVFRFAGTTAFIAYSVALWQMSIWYHRSWTITIKTTIDGLVYGLLMAGTFGWLWPR
ncbi:MAG TPA: hypothetical protein VLV45_02360 [Gemmatimonadales bacterium]|nr:hypothetical protein [Gemmatimonadales bacterium]